MFCRRLWVKPIPNPVLSFFRLRMASATQFKKQAVDLAALKHIMQTPRGKVSGVRHRNAACILQFLAADDVRKKSLDDDLRKALCAFCNHIDLPASLSEFECFLLAQISKRHAQDVANLTRPSWMEKVLAVYNPRFGPTWTFQHCTEITHSHAMLTKFDSYCLSAREYWQAAEDKPKAIRTIAVCQRWRTEEAFVLLKEKQGYLSSWTDLGNFATEWEAEHRGTARELYPGRRLWPDQSLSAGSTGETKRCSIGEACTTMRCNKGFDEHRYVSATAKRKREMIESLTGVGDLNGSHLSRVLSLACSCGPAQSSVCGTNAELGLSLTGAPDLETVAKRLTPFLWYMGLLSHSEHLQAEEVQMDLCVAIYAIQTLMVGSNSHHPRLSMRTKVSAKSLLPMKQLKARKRLTRDIERPSKQQRSS